MSTSTPLSEQSSTYTVTARKWRPTLFNGVVGQEHVTQTLRNAVQSGRVHHAYIFNGPRGVGKTTTARILAKALNCLNPGPDAEPCNECASCTDISTGRSIDVIEIDGASNNSVDDVRKLRENAKYPPTGGRYKMYIIDEVHMLSTSAFNALLKTLEEPPRHLIFVFATTEPHRVPATILSRCQRFDFRRMQIDDIVGHLQYIAEQEHITIDDESLTVIAKKGDGSMRDSQSIFDQVVSFCGTTVSYAHVNEALNLIDQEFFFTVSRAIRQRDIPTILELTRQIFIRGYDLQECLNGLAEHFRNILTVIATGNAGLIETSKAFHDMYVKEAGFFSQADVLQLMNLIITTEQALRFAPQPRLRFEFALIQMAQMDSAVDLAVLLQELDDLKKKLESGAIVPSAPVSPGSAQVPAQPPAASASRSAVVRESTPAYTAAPTETASAPQAPQAAQETRPASPTTASREHDATVHAPAERAPAERAPAEAGGSAPAQPVQAAAPAPQARTGNAGTTDGGNRTVTGDELRQRWDAFIRSSDQLDAAFKRLAKTGMFTTAFADAEVVLTPTQPIVAGTLNEKKVAVADALKLFFGGVVTVHVAGGAGSDKPSFFDELPAGPPVQPGAGTNGGTQNTAGSPRAQTVQTSPGAEQGAVGEDPGTPQNSVQHEGDLHPLDKAIIDHFHAQEVPLR